MSDALSEDYVAASLRHNRPDLAPSQGSTDRPEEVQTHARSATVHRKPGSVESESRLSDLFYPAINYWCFDTTKYRAREWPKNRYGRAPNIWIVCQPTSRRTRLASTEGRIDPTDMRCRGRSS